MNRLPGWKRLLLQALEQAAAPRPASRWNPFPAIHWHRIAHQQAGILQPSPLHSLRLAWLWWRCDDARSFVDACHQSVMRAKQPRQLPPVLLIWPLLAGILLLPRLATTSITPGSHHSPLRQPIVAGLDHDLQTRQLPIASDYDRAAFRAVDDTFYRAGLHGPDWLETQGRGYYGLQLMSASRPENLVKFCRQHGICRESVVIDARIDGKPLWRLLTGRYRDRDSARAALGGLSPTLQALKPWPRPYAALLTARSRQP